MIFAPVPPPSAFPSTASILLFSQYKTAYTGPVQVAARPLIEMTGRPNLFDFKCFLPSCIRADYSMDIRLRHIPTNVTTILSTIQLTSRIVYEGMEHQGGLHIIKNYDMRTQLFAPGNYALSVVLRDQLNVTKAVSLAQNYIIS